jgi:putative sterol carrier protein
MEEILKSWIEKARERIAGNEKIREEVKEFEGAFQLEITDGQDYYVMMKDSEIGDLTPGKAEKPRFVLISDTATLEALLNREIAIWKAVAKKKLSWKGSLDDVIRLRKIIKVD